MTYKPKNITDSDIDNLLKKDKLTLLECAYIAAGYNPESLDNDSKKYVFDESTDIGKIIKRIYNLIGKSSENTSITGDIKSHVDGIFETVKHAERRAKHHENLPKILDLGHEKADLLHYFPAFCGDLTLNRYLTLYELYKETSGIPGHIAEVGVFKGAGSILFGKLINLFERDSLTMVHGFDHFGGIDIDTDSPLQVPGGDSSNENTLRELIRLQNLDSTIKIHNLDAARDLPEFFENNPHIRFKLVFLDSGTYNITSEAIKAFWPRLNIGGIMIFDQYNNEVAPGETRAIHELLPNEKIETLTGSWMPSAYIRKGVNPSGL